MILVEQIRGARAMVGLSQQELAEKAGISTGTLNNIERGVQLDPKISTLRSIQQALEAEGIQFTEHDRGRFGIEFRPPALKGGTRTILIIDDNEIDRKLYRVWLLKHAHHDYQIIEASNAKDGYQSFFDHKPACIILDFMMYGKDGFQLLVEMKKDLVHIPPILFVTATYNNAIKKDVLGLGMNTTYLDKKNLTEEKLQEAVSQALTN